MEMLPSGMSGRVHGPREKRRMLLLSPRGASFPRGHEVLELLRAKDFWFYFFSQSSRLWEGRKVFLSFYVFFNFLLNFFSKYCFSHQWVHPDEAAEKSKQTARYDYHQTPDKIYCNVYCKGIIPKDTKVAISAKRVDINVSCFYKYIYSVSSTFRR